MGNNNANSANEINSLTKQMKNTKNTGSKDFRSSLILSLEQTKWKKDMGLELKKLSSVFEWPKLVLQRLESDSLLWDSVHTKDFGQLYNIGEEYINKANKEKQVVITSLKGELNRSYLIKEEVVESCKRKKPLEERIRSNALVQISGCLESEQLELLERRVVFFNECSRVMEQIFNQNEKSILKKIVQLFKLEYQKKWQKFIEQNKVNCTQMDQEIWAFTKSLMVMLNGYFQMEQFIQIYSPYSGMMSSSNLINVVMNLIFDDQMYCMVYEAKKLEQREVNRVVHANIQQLRSKKDCPIYFGVSAQFCLNERTRDYLRGKEKENLIWTSSSMVGSESTQNENGEITPIMVIESCPDRSPEPERPMQRHMMGSLIGEVEQQPYSEAIKTLNMMQLLTTPLFKLKALVECFESIFQCISQFYAGCRMPMTKSQQAVDSDELLNIFTYILCQCSVGNLCTHLEIMKKFCQNTGGVSDYYVTVMEAVIEMIKNQ